MSKTILITGAAAGIGRDAALSLAARGHKVIASTHKVEQAKALKAFAKKNNLVLEARKLDITNLADLKRFSKVKVDVLINNAAVGESGPLAEVPFERLQNIVDTNILGTLRVTQFFAKPMLKRGSGRIITLSSVAGLIALPHLGIYNLTKFALEGAFDSLRMEMKPYGVDVSLIEPGLIYTTFNERMFATKYEWLTKKSAFKKDFPAMRRHDKGITANSYPTTSVVKAIVHAVESRRPKTRYIRPRHYARTALLAKLLPDRLKDRILRGYAGLT